MILTFTGTGSGKSSLKRYHSSLLLDADSERCLIDCGDGISKALLSQDINYNSITSIIITHFHPDHYTGILTLLVNMRLTNRKSPLNIYIHKSMNEFFDSLLLHSYLDGIRKRFPINIEGYHNNKSIKLSSKLKILPRLNSHIRNKLEIENRDVFYSSSLLINNGEEKVLYTSDIGDADDLLLFYDYSIDYLICETTHISIDDILSTIEARGIANTYLTHIDDKDEKILLQTTFKRPNITVAYDGLKISI